MMRVISMSAVAEGPEMKVVAKAAVGWRRPKASGTVWTMSCARTMQRW